MVRIRPAGRRIERLYCRKGIGRNCRAAEETTRRSLKHEGVRHVVYDRGLAVRRQMMGSEKPLAESGVDSRYRLFDIAVFRDFLYFVHHYAVPILVEPLALAQPENFVSFDDQSCIPSAAGVDSDRVLPMRDPCSA